MRLQYLVLRHRLSPLNFRPRLSPLRPRLSPLRPRLSPLRLHEMPLRLWTRLSLERFRLRVRLNPLRRLTPASGRTTVFGEILVVGGKEIDLARALSRRRKRVVTRVVRTSGADVVGAGTGDWAAIAVASFVSRGVNSVPRMNELRAQRSKAKIHLH